jgi:opacity protein-like surface antigen
MLVQRIARVAAVSFVVATRALAQESGTDTASSAWPTQRVHTRSEFARRSSGSFALIQSRPLGDLKSNIGFGYGGSAAYMFRLDHSGVLSLRGDGALLDYGHESMHVPLSPTIGGRIQVKVVTSNYVVPLSVGPQLTWPTGSVRPYVTAGIGGQYFYTESHIADRNEDSNAFSTTNQHDWTSAWVAGGGLYVQLAKKSGVNISLDLGVQYMNGGHAQYLKPGSIEDLANAQIRITPLESDTRMTLVRAGVRIGL